jgi:hypothetical protein
LSSVVQSTLSLSLSSSSSSISHQRTPRRVRGAPQREAAALAASRLLLAVVASREDRSMQLRAAAAWTAALQLLVAA